MSDDLLFMRRAATIARNSKCWIGMGCVIAKGNKILVEAWSETLLGEEYCQEFRIRNQKSRTKDSPSENVGCIRHELGLTQGREIEKVCSVHSEVNAIAKAAAKGIAITGATMYVTSFPCLICMRSIIAAGIKKVVYMNDFYKPHHMELFKKNGVLVEQITESDVWKQEL